MDFKDAAGKEALPEALAAITFSRSWVMPTRTSLWSCVKNTGSNTFTRIMKLPQSAWRTVGR
jgi:hypothetical protein